MSDSTDRFRKLIKIFIKNAMEYYEMPANSPDFRMHTAWYMALGEAMDAWNGASLRSIATYGGSHISDAHRLLTRIREQEGVSTIEDAWDWINRVSDQRVDELIAHVMCER